MTSFRASIHTVTVINIIESSKNLHKFLGVIAISEMVCSLSIASQRPIKGFVSMHQSP